MFFEMGEFFYLCIIVRDDDYLDYFFNLGNVGMVCFGIFFIVDVFCNRMVMCGCLFVVQVQFMVSDIELLLKEVREGGFFKDFENLIKVVVEVGCDLR